MQHHFVVENKIIRRRSKEKIQHVYSEESDDKQRYNLTGYAGASLPGRQGECRARSIESWSFNRQEYEFCVNRVKEICVGDFKDEVHRQI